MIYFYHSFWMTLYTLDRTPGIPGSDKNHPGSSSSSITIIVIIIGQNIENSILYTLLLRQIFPRSKSEIQIGLSHGGWHQTPVLPFIWQRANVYVSVSPAFAGLNKLCKPFESTGSAQKQIYQMSLNNEYLSARVCCKGLVRETAVGKAKDNNKL